MQFAELSKTLVALPLADRIAAMEVLWGTLDQAANQEQSVCARHRAGVQRGLADAAAGHVRQWQDAKRDLDQLDAA